MVGFIFNPIIHGLMKKADTIFWIDLKDWGFMAGRWPFCWRSPKGHSCVFFLMLVTTWYALTLAKKDQLRIIVRSLSDFIWMDGNLSVWIHVGYLSSHLLWVSRRWLFPGQMASIGPSIGLKYGPLVCFWKRETKPNQPSYYVAIFRSLWHL